MVTGAPCCCPYYDPELDYATTYVTAQAQQRPSAVFWKSCYFSAWPSLLPPRESLVQMCQPGPSAPCSHPCTTHPEGTFSQQHYLALPALYLAYCLCLCFLPLQSWEGKAAVYIFSYSCFPKWCDVSAETTAPEVDLTLFKVVSTAYWSCAVDKRLGFFMLWFLHF